MITWLKEGDANMKFFHLIANGKRNKNFVPHIWHNEVLIEGEQNLGKAFTEHI